MSKLFLPMVIMLEEQSLFYFVFSVEKRIRDAYQKKKVDISRGYTVIYRREECFASWKKKAFSCRDDSLDSVLWKACLLVFHSRENVALEIQEGTSNKKICFLRILETVALLCSVLLVILAAKIQQIL